MSKLVAPAYRFASPPAGSRVLRVFVPSDRRVLAATKGKYSLFGPGALPSLLLTTTGRKSGLPRTTVPTPGGR